MMPEMKKATRRTNMKTTSNRLWSRRIEDYDSLLSRAFRAFDSFYSEEPRLLFEGSNRSANPKRGILDWGPPGKLQVRPSIRLAVVGTRGSVDRLSSYV